MQYDPSLIEVSTIMIDGKPVRYEKIPAGMNGPNGPLPALSEEFDDDDTIIDTTFSEEDDELYKEYNEYVEEGIEPDSDEVRAIKEEIESEFSEGILDIIDLDDEEEMED